MSVLLLPFFFSVVNPAFYSLLAGLMVYFHGSSKDQEKFKRNEIGSILREKDIGVAEG